MKIQTVQGNTWYLDGPGLCIGLYLTDPKHCVLLDCGPTALRERIEAGLAAAGLQPIGIFATHAHFDHFGNAAYFQKKYGIPVALSFGEAELCRTFPAIKSHLFVYSAGEVMNDPELKVLPCNVDRVLMPSEEELYFCGVRFRVIRTPGHSPEHISILTPDRVCYAGDALMTGKTLAGAKLPYAYNPSQCLESMALLRDIPCDAMLLTHAGVIRAPFDSLVEENMSHMRAQLAAVLRLIDRPMSREEIMEAVRDSMHIRVDTPRKAEDLERFLRPYLECLTDEGRLRMSVRGTGTLCYGPASVRQNGPPAAPFQPST